MSKVPTLIIAPSIESRLREQFLVEPLPAGTLDEGLVGNTKGRASEGMPVDGILVELVEFLLDVGLSKVQ